MAIVALNTDFSSPEHIYILQQFSVHLITPQ